MNIGTERAVGVVVVPALTVEGRSLRGLLSLLSISCIYICRVVMVMVIVVVLVVVLVLVVIRNCARATNKRRQKGFGGALQIATVAPEG